jgi:hypothetical protein
MASTGRVFFAGVATTFVILTIGFGGGVMLAKSAVEPSAERPSSANVLPVRVILPASAEPAAQPQPPVRIAEPENPPRPAATQDAPQVIQTDQKSEGAQRRRAIAEEQTRKKLAERKARREAARIAIQQQEHQQRQKRQVGIVAFGPDDAQPPGGGAFFGN